MDFDLDAVNTRDLSEQGVFMTINRIDGNGPLLNKHDKPVRIKLLGPDSEKFNSMMQQQVKARLQRNIGADGTKVDVDEFALGQKDALDILVACTVGWENLLVKGEDRDVPFTPDNVRQLYSAFPVIRDQADAFINRRANFTLASSKG